MVSSTSRLICLCIGAQERRDLINMNIKMIVTDLDGTFLREDKTVSERTMSAFRRCREKGFKIVYATGRGASSKTLVPSELFDGFVRCNGASAYINDSLIYSNLVEIDTVRPLLLAADAAGIDIVAECGDVNYANFDASERWEWIENINTVDFNTLGGKAEKLYVASAVTQEIIDVLNAHVPANLYIYLSNDGFALVMHKDSTKSRAVNALANKWNIKQNEIVSFGDDTNDIDLLEYSGIGVAMGNALDTVKQSADIICDTNENDGIAKWLEENVL